MHVVTKYEYSPFSHGENSLLHELRSTLLIEKEIQISFKLMASLKAVLMKRKYTLLSKTHFYIRKRTKFKGILIHRLKYRFSFLSLK